MSRRERHRERMERCWQRHMRRHARHHQHGCGPDGGPRWRFWRMHSRLRHRLFWWFGAAIAVSAGVAAGTHHLLGGHAGPAPLIAGAVVLWAASGVIAWRLTRPLGQLIRVTREIGDGRLDARLELHGRSRDFGELADAVNDMAERLQAQAAGQRELLAAVSHEIRTPLGHMRILVDTGRDAGPGPWADLEREVLEVDALVDQLLAGSRLDFSALDRRELDAAAVALLALERAGLDASLLEPPATTLRVEADPTLLGRALANLLANARGHGGGATALRVRRGDREVQFEVDDGGPGIPAEDVGRVFEPFYRGKEGKGGSLGLGLALVRRIAEAHGGRAWAENRAGGGARVGFSVGVA
jgi:signal transduction histidine kinase